MGPGLSSLKMEKTRGFRPGINLLSAQASRPGWSLQASIPRHAGINLTRPGVDAPVQRTRLGIAMGLEETHGAQRPQPVVAVNQDPFVLRGKAVREPLVPPRQGPWFGHLDPAEGVLVRFAAIDQTPMARHAQNG